MTTSRQVGHSAARWSSQGWFLVAAMALLTGCGEPMFENAGSPNSLLEDREACAKEMEKSPAALAYRQNPTAHPEYVSQVFTWREKRGQATFISAGGRDGARWIQVPGPSRVAVTTQECQRAVGASHRCGMQ